MALASASDLWPQLVLPMHGPWPEMLGVPLPPPPLVPTSTPVPAVPPPPCLGAQLSSVFLEVFLPPPLLPRPGTPAFVSRLSMAGGQQIN